VTIHWENYGDDWDGETQLENLVIDKSELAKLGDNADDESDALRSLRKKRN